MSTYASPIDILPETKALSNTINDLDAAVSTAFGLLPSETDLTRGTVNYAVDTGAINAYLVALPHIPSGYIDGLLVDFRPLTTNSGAATINVNSLGIKSIKNAINESLEPNDITVGVPVTLRYSSATGFFHVQSNSEARAAEASASAAAALVSKNAASASASAAATSASTATTQASNAATSASTATTQASNAAASASTATTQASNAASSASTATTQATNAAASASTATTQATNASTSATNAAASASTAINAPGTSATSVTSAVIGSGSKSLIIQSGKSLVAGMWVIAADSAAPSTNQMIGSIDSYNSGTGALVFTVPTGNFKGSGTLTSWIVSLTAPGGATLDANTYTGDQVMSDRQLSRAMFKDCADVFLDKGNSGTSLVTFDYTAGSHQQVTATGNHTWALSNWPPSGNRGILQISYINAGSYVLTPPGTIQWLLYPNSHTTSLTDHLASLGLTSLAASGISDILLWTRDGGTTVYGKVMI